MRETSNESSLDDSYLLEESEEAYYPLPVMIPLYGELLLLVALLSGGFLLPLFFKNEEAQSTDTFSAVIYLHIVIWVLITILTWYVKAEHKTSRILGYHVFYNATRHLHRVAFYILSGGNVLMLVVSCVTHNFCVGGGVSPCSFSIDLSPVNYLQIIFILEAILSLPLLSKHIVEVFGFNQRRLPPDALRGNNPNQIDQRALVVGVRGSEHLERLLTQQADQLMTLSRHNEMLSDELEGFLPRNTEALRSSANHLFH